MELDEDFLAKMREATELLQTSGPAAATAAIQRALKGFPGASPAQARPTRAWTAHASATRAAPSQGSTPRAAPTRASSTRPSWSLTTLRPAALLTTRGAAVGADEAAADPGVSRDGKGRFLAASLRNHSGTRSYKVYVPSRYRGQPLPLIVMLHGCKQDPDDFAIGTGMNVIAEQNDCFVVYPGQARAANGSNCWNWFKVNDQQRDRGEPSIIADITRAVIREYHIDPSRVYVAGLSAGGAMAAIMGATYPDLYAAVGIHSGLPVGAAHDLPSAFAAMKNGATRARSRSASGEPMPIIVFHGDRDGTVHPRNGEQALAQCVEASRCDVTVQEGRVPNGHAYTRTVRHDAHGKPMAEQWVVHGAGHAWFGGDREGSYTDPKGPNASREMVRFFSAHARALS